MTEVRKLAVSIVVVVVALAGVGTWVMLGLNRGDDIRVTIEQKRQQLSALREKIAAVPSLRQERQKIGDELAEYETILPNESELNKIFETLGDFQKRAGVEIRSVTPQQVMRQDPGAPTTSYKQVAYDLSLAGDYFSFVRFLNLLETHNRFIQVESFGVRQHDESNLVDEITIRLSTFVYDPAAKPVVKPRPGAHAAAVPAVIFDLKKEFASRFVYAGNTSVRDPFSNPLTRRVAATGTPGVRVAPNRLMSGEEERADVENVQKKLVDAEALISQDKLEEAAKLVIECDYVRTQLYRDTDAAQRAVALSREWQRLDVKVRQAKGEKLYRIVEDLYGNMKRAFEAEDYDRVFKLRATVDERVGPVLKKPDVAAPQSPKPEVAPDGLESRLAELVKACAALAQRASIRREAAGIAIQIQGTFWSGRGDARKAAAIINGQTLVVGDILKPDGAGKSTADPAAEIVVRSIGREKVVFGYKGELIERSQFKTE